MDVETLAALEGSIEKWERIVAGTGHDGGTTNCPLCQRFLMSTGTCAGCPVSQKTKSLGCFESPYARWVEFRKDHGNVRAISDFPEDAQIEATRLAQAELDFLKGLLP